MLVFHTRGYAGCLPSSWCCCSFTQPRILLGGVAEPMQRHVALHNRLTRSMRYSGSRCVVHRLKDLRCPWLCRCDRSLPWILIAQLEQNGSEVRSCTVYSLCQARHDGRLNSLLTAIIWHVSNIERLESKKVVQVELMALLCIAVRCTVF